MTNNIVSDYSSLLSEFIVKISEDGNIVKISDEGRPALVSDGVERFITNLGLTTTERTTSFMVDLRNRNSLLIEDLARISASQQVRLSQEELADMAKAGLFPSGFLSCLIIYGITQNSKEAIKLADKIFVRALDEFLLQVANVGRFTPSKLKGLPISKVSETIFTPESDWRRAFYHDFLAPMWPALYGNQLFEKTIDKNGKTKINLDQGNSLYAMFIKGLGEEMEKVYKILNPYTIDKNGKRSRFRKHTFTTIVNGMLESEAFGRVLMEHVANLNRIMVEVVAEYDLHHLMRIDSPDLEKTRIKARAKMFRLIAKLPKIEAAVMQIINDDEKPNQNMLPPAK